MKYLHSLKYNINETVENNCWVQLKYFNKNILKQIGTMFMINMGEMSHNFSNVF